MAEDLIGDRTITVQLRGRAHISGHERKVGKEEAETQDPSVSSLREMRMGVRSHYSAGDGQGSAQGILSTIAPHGITHLKGRRTVCRSW